MGQLGVILGLIFSLFIAVFALANNQLIVVNYLFGKADISAVIVILGAACLGALSVFLLGVYKQIKGAFRLRGLQGEVGDLRSRLQQLEFERDNLLVQLGQLQQSPADNFATVAEHSSPGMEIKKQDTPADEKIPAVACTEDGELQMPDKTPKEENGR